MFGDPGLVAAESQGSAHSDCIWGEAEGKLGPRIYMEAGPGVRGVQGHSLQSASTVGNLQGPRGVSGDVPATARI